MAAKPKDDEQTGDDAAEEAAVNAELAADHAAKAEASLAAAERDLAEATKDARAKLCPNDNAEMVKHGPANPYKAGSWHCNVCGTCWAPGIRVPR